MRILATEYSPLTKSFDIFVSGCKSPHCKYCFNEESWDFDKGDLVTYKLMDEIISKILSFSKIIDRVFIMGGEPLNQDPRELEGLMLILRTQAHKDIWLFTRYQLLDIPKDILEETSYVKCGRYVDSEKCTDNIQYGINLASKNQIIYKRGVDY